MTSSHKSLKGQAQKHEKYSFLLRNLGVGLAWLVGILVGFYFLGDWLEKNHKDTLDYLGTNTLLVYLTFSASELLFGLLPPEFFLLWAMREQTLSFYVWSCVFFSVISYLIGTACYGIGRKIGQSRRYRKFLYRYLRKEVFYLHKYGGFLLIVACLTPVPFTGICLLFGSIKFRFPTLLNLALFRFLRFLIYAIVIGSAQSFLQKGSDVLSLL